MWIVILLVVLLVVILVKWLPTYLEYQKIGAYKDYTPISKHLNDKGFEYIWYQINGFKNIDAKAMKYMYQVSACVSPKDLKWLNECKNFLEEGLVKSGENNEAAFSISDPIENAGLVEILKVLKRSRKILPSHYQSMGCHTCGEAIVMHIWISLRIEQIQNHENIKPKDLDYVVEAVKEIQNH